MRPRGSLLLVALFVAASGCPHEHGGGPGTPTPVDTVAFHGTLASFTGSGAILTLASNASPVAGTASLQGTLSGSATFDCLAPDAVSLNTYEILYRGTDYRITVSVQPGVWTSGTHPVDGGNVALSLLRISDFAAAKATSGVLDLVTAPTAVDASGSVCRFSGTAIRYFQ